jgi:hypothetical protein
MNEENTTASNNLQPEKGENGEELDALRSENAELRQAARIASARDMVTTALRRLGASSPALLFESAKGDLQFDEAGAPVNTEALVMSLRGKYPEQFAAAPVIPTVDAGAGRNAAPPLTRAALAVMTPAEIERLDWFEVCRVLSNQ